MDPSLKALCLEVLGGNIDSEKFTWLMIETGIQLEGHEFEVANHLLRQGDANASLAKQYGMTIH
jgi:hypothetical protein